MLHITEQMFKGDIIFLNNFKRNADAFLYTATGIEQAPMVISGEPLQHPEAVLAHSHEITK